MAGKIGTAQVINYVNTTSAEAQGVRAFYGIGGAGVRVAHTANPPVISHIITETGTDIFLTETDDQLFITESS
jgi:predicted ThiF/HesA family dinucleotide-utilizing enzyme